MPSENKKKKIAFGFFCYLLENKYLSERPGNMERDELIKLFDFYRTSVNTSISIKSDRIFSILDEAKLITRNNISEFVKFKPDVFKSDVAKNFKLHINNFDISKNENSKYDPTEHENTTKVLRDRYLGNRESFPTKLPGIEITPIQENKMALDNKQFRLIKIIIKNVVNEKYSFQIHNLFKIEKLDGLQLNYCISPDCDCIILNDEVFTVDLLIPFVKHAKKTFPFVLRLQGQGSPTHEDLLIETIFDSNEDDLDAYLAPSEPYKHIAMNIIIFPDAPIIEGIKRLIYTIPLKADQFLREYFIPDFLEMTLDHFFLKLHSLSLNESIRLLLQHDPKSNKVFGNRKSLNVQNYIERFHRLLWIEEHQAHMDMRSFNQTDVELDLRRKGQGLYGINVPGLSESRPSVLEGDKLYIRPKYENLKYASYVHDVQQKKIFVAPNKKFENVYIEDDKVDIEFTINRLFYRLCHRALDQIRGLTDALFPQTPKKKTKTKDLTLFNKQILENDRQYEAIKNIVDNTAYPAPYVVFGPPGTGKTATLVEAILQVWKIFKKKRICVCAPSNSASDVITEKLLKDMPSESHDEVMRLYGLSRSVRSIPKNILKCSNINLDEKTIFMPTKDQVENKRIVVMTSVTAGRLVSAGFKFQEGFFDYLFIDEAGRAVEVETLIPIAGFLTEAGKKTLSGSLILAGDPKQLGPKVRSKLAVAFGYEISLLERLMFNCKLYEKNVTYDTNVITKLIHNYRSHEVILHIPNICFYDGELEVKGRKEKITCAREWKELNDPDFPMIFHGVIGQENRESTSPSYFNVAEIKIVKYYLESLLGCKWNEYTVTQKDIGIITPYRKQVEKIRKYLKKKSWDSIDVASIEQFQGQERLIIIVSTVRSNPKLVPTDCHYGLGFLKNPKMFNVTVTRAIALLIVIGNPNILRSDPYWRQLIDYCISNNTYKGDRPSGSYPQNLNFT